MKETKTYRPSIGQQRLWLYQHLFPESVAYSVCVSVRVSGALDLQRCQSACEALFAKYEILRSAFPNVMRAEINEQAQLDFQVIDYIKSNEASPLSNNELIAIISELASQPYSLEKGGLFFVRVVRIGPTDAIILFSGHHIVADGSSYGLLFRDFIRVYCGENIQAQDCNAIITRDETAKNDELPLEFWLKKLDDVETLHFPTEYPRSKKKSNIKELLVSVDERLLEQARVFARSVGSSQAKVLLTVFSILLHRFSQQNSFHVGLPTHGRLDETMRDRIGHFVNLLPICFRYNTDLTFKSLVLETSSLVNEAVIHQNVPYEEIIKRKKIKRHRDHDPLFTAFFNAVNYSVIDGIGDEEMQITPFWANSGLSDCDISLTVYQMIRGNELSWKYDASLFSEAFIARVSDHYENILQQVVANPETRIGEISMRLKSEEKTIKNIGEFCSMEGVSYSNLMEVLKMRAEQDGKRAAVISEEENLDYATLYRQSLAIAKHIINKYGCQKKKCIALLFGHDPGLLKGVLASLLTGAYYVSIDVKYPSKRIDYILRDSGAEVVITNSCYLSSFHSNELTTLCLDESLPDVEIQDNADLTLPVDIMPEQIAYLVYTSGTTGSPKGVKNTHHGLMNLAEFQKKALSLQNESARVLQFAATGFDAFVWEWTFVVITGSSLVFSKNLLVGDSLAAAINDNAITHVTLPTSVLKTISNEELPSLRVVVVAGEACSQDLIKKWSNKVRLINAYGPSETTVCATTFLCDISHPAATIGSPIRNMRVEIIDQYKKPLPIGAIGELIVGGAGVAAGYVNQPELTEKKFVHYPWIAEGVFYKTGDLCRYLSDGNIEYIGRNDHMIKINGFRVETEEIEFHIKEQINVKDATVIDIDDDDGLKKLVAFVVLHGKKDADEGEKAIKKTIVCQLKEKISYFMIPSRIIIVESIPVGAHGKIDKASLMERYKAYAGEKNQKAHASEGEEAMMVLWSEVLGHDDFDADDNFFDIGGHSLSVVSLSEKVSQNLGLNCRVIDIYQNPTPRKLIKAFTKSETRFHSVVPLKIHHRKKDVFCIHPIGGNVHCYHGLAKMIAGQFNVHGICSRGLMTEQKALYNIEAMAAAYLDEMVALHPKGPCHIVGYCMGGLVAYEMVRLMEKKGLERGKLIIVDSFISEGLKSAPDLNTPVELMKFFLYMALVTSNKLYVYQNEAEKLSGEKASVSALKNILVKHDVYDSSLSQQALTQLLHITGVNYHAFQHYQPDFRYLPEEVIMVYAADTLAEQSDGKGTSFGLFADALEPVCTSMQVVDANHDNILLEPQLGSWVTQCFKQLKS